MFYEKIIYLVRCIVFQIIFHTVQTNLCSNKKTTDIKDTHLDRHVYVNKSCKTNLLYVFKKKNLLYKQTCMGAITSKTNNT